MKKELLGSEDNMDEVTELPSRGLDETALIAKTKEYLDMGEFDWTAGTQSGTVYNGNPELTKVMTEVYGMAAWSNPLHPDTFPGKNHVMLRYVDCSVHICFTANTTN